MNTGNIAPSSACLTDLDECADDNGGCRCDVDEEICESTCHNQDGSHECSCPKGYYLMSDERTCSGETSSRILVTLNPLTSGVAYIRFFIFISTLSTTF